MKLALIVNCRDWAWDHKAHNIKRELLLYGVQSDIYYMYDIIPDPRKQNYDTGKQLYDRIPYEKYDIVIMFSLILEPVFNSQMDYSRTYVSITSHTNYSGDPENRYQIQKFKKFRGVFVVNKKLLNQFEGIVPNLYYCPNGVDIKHFTPKKMFKKDHRFDISWVGDPLHSVDKGFEDIVFPLANLPNVHLSLADSMENYVPYSQMPLHYNSSDIHICASDSEGTPNPCLEAAACGIPIVTTPVGNMSEFIVDGWNGFLVEKRLSAFKRCIQYFRDNPLEVQRMGQNARKTAVNWAWSIMIKNYLFMFRQSM